MFINQNKISYNSYFMRLALYQAQKNLGNTKENPSVGCVITKNNSVISVGSTGLNGRPHAEKNAISFSQTFLKGSELYSTLEPCSHYGLTPPCTKLIIKNKIKKVIFSIKDPDLRSNDMCNKILRNNKIKTTEGICLNELNLFYRSYIKSKTSFLPFVTCKIAISKDYFTVNKKKKWITNKFSRGRVHLMRSNHDCIITSSKTIIEDNPRLTCRIDGLYKRTPARIILDNKLKVPISSNVIKDARKYKTIIFYNKYDKKKAQLLKKFKVDLYKIPLNKNRDLNLKMLLIKAKTLGFYRIFLESGMKLSTNFLNYNLVDDLKIFVSDKNLGKNGSHNIKKYFKSLLKNKHIKKEKVNLFGEEILTYNLN